MWSSDHHSAAGTRPPARREVASARRPAARRSCRRTTVRGPATCTPSRSTGTRYSADQAYRVGPYRLHAGSKISGHNRNPVILGLGEFCSCESFGRGIIRVGKESTGLGRGRRAEPVGERSRQGGRDVHVQRDRGRLVHGCETGNRAERRSMSTGCSCARSTTTRPCRPMTCTARSPGSRTACTCCGSSSSARVGLRMIRFPARQSYCVLALSKYRGVVRLEASRMRASVRSRAGCRGYCQRRRRHSNE